MVRRCCYYECYQKQKYKDENVIKIDGVSLWTN